MKLSRDLTNALKAGTAMSFTINVDDIPMTWEFDLAKPDEIVKTIIAVHGASVGGTHCETINWLNSVVSITTARNAATRLAEARRETRKAEREIEASKLFARASALQQDSPEEQYEPEVGTDPSSNTGEPGPKRGRWALG